MENRFAVTERVAGAVWREITTVAAMGREEKGRRRALRIKVCASVCSSKAVITSARRCGLQEHDYDMIHGRNAVARVLCFYFY